jgi:predicted acyltransferase
MLWGMEFPIIKKLWTSSYVLYAGGWSLLLLALFYAVIDVLDVRRWAIPFVWIGSNCLAIYLLDNIVSFRDLVGRVIHADTEAMLGKYGPLVISVLALGMAIAICGMLYRRRIFVRL